MKTVTLRSVVRGAGLFLALAFPWLLAGCGGLAYNDPNVPASERYFNTAGAHPINATGAQATSTAEPQTINPAIAPPRLAGVSSNAPIVPSSSKLGVGDLLTISFSDIPPNSGLPPEQQHRIGDDGLINLPFNVQIQAAGKTPTQLQQEIRKAYVPAYFVNLSVTVKAQDRFVYVDGEVKAPNRQFHIDGLTVLRVISTAGGFTDFASKNNIEVRRAIGGKVETVNWSKARKNPKLDLPMYVNDQVYVPRRVL